MFCQVSKQLENGESPCRLYTVDNPGNHFHWDKKKPFMTEHRVKNSLQDVGDRTCYLVNNQDFTTFTSGFTTRCELSQTQRPGCSSHQHMKRKRYITKFSGQLSIISWPRANTSSVVVLVLLWLKHVWLHVDIVNLHWHFFYWQIYKNEWKMSSSSVSQDLAKCVKSLDNNLSFSRTRVLIIWLKACRGEKGE